MEGKLYKTNNNTYILVDPTKGTYDDGYTLGTSRESQFNKLSIKNCQTIELGYDLDELLDNITPNNGTTGNISERIGFVKGFQKALELMGDKKFSEEDIHEAYYLGEREDRSGFHDLLHLKQQTEWDVEVEMICPHPSDTYRCGLQYGCDGDGCNHPKQVPYLDADGCLILKKI